MEIKSEEEFKKLLDEKTSLMDVMEALAVAFAETEAVHAQTQAERIAQKLKVRPDLSETEEHCFALILFALGTLCRFLRLKDHDLFFLTELLFRRATELKQKQKAKNTQ